MNKFKAYLFFALWMAASISFSATVQNLNETGPGSLADAIARAADGEKITFDSALSGKKIVLIDHPLTITNNIQIDASSLPLPITISRAGDIRVPSHIFSIQQNASAVLTNLRLISDHTGDGIDYAILNRGILTTFNCNVDLNDGGGIYNGPGAVSDLHFTSVSQNFRDGLGGAGIYNATGGTITLSNCKILENRSYYGGSGAGIYNEPGAKASFVDCDLSQNRGENQGGAIYNAGELTLLRVNISGNSSFDGNGIFNTGTLKADACSFQSNGGQYLGEGSIDTNGTIHNAAGVVTLNDCWFKANLARNGGAIYSDHGTLTLNRNSFSENHAVGAYGGGGSGGAIECFSTMVAITNCAFYANRAEGYGFGTPDTGEYYGLGGYGGAMKCMNGSFTMENTTIVKNFGGDYTDDPVAVIVSSTNAIIKNCIVAGNRAPNLPAAKDINGTYSGSHNFVGGDPFVGEFGFHGGITPTLPLLPTSPAIDAGGDTIAITDQRGFPRRKGPAVDIGAFEFGSALPRPPESISLIRKDDGQVSLNFTADPGVTFTVLAHGNLDDSTSSWQPLGYATEQDGAYSFIHNPESAPTQFYTVRFP